ncbi:hypothetical protein HGRIS_000201 [Hohenbuehelia grisea]|uniref:Uncharacterized protein n=1 Tax=Hohenbuehelia grisea TaxID=104357 RepID=A0ABR3JQC8_9AGAR
MAEEDLYRNVEITSLKALWQLSDAIEAVPSRGPYIESFTLTLQSHIIGCFTVGNAFRELGPHLTNLRCARIHAPFLCPHSLAYVFRALTQGQKGLELQISAVHHTVPHRCSWAQAIRSVRSLSNSPKAVLCSFEGPAPLVALFPPGMDSLTEVKLDFPESAAANVKNVVAALATSCGPQLSRLTCLRDRKSLVLLQALAGVSKGFPRLEELVIARRVRAGANAPAVVEDSDEDHATTDDESAQGVLQLASCINSLRSFTFESRQVIARLEE